MVTAFSEGNVWEAELRAFEVRFSEIIQDSVT